MKNLSLLILCLMLVGGTFLGGCKKGEEDPFISLRSRDARIKGDWKLSSYTSTETYSNGGGIGGPVQVTSTSNYDGTNLTTTFVGGGNSGTETYSFSQKLSIEDDGRYTVTSVEDGKTSTFSGNWVWLDSDKNKSYISFDSGFGSAFGAIYLRMLKNDEMQWVTDNSEVSDDPYVFHSEYTWTAE